MTTDDAACLQQDHIDIADIVSDDAPNQAESTCTCRPVTTYSMSNAADKRSSTVLGTWTPRAQWPVFPAIGIIGKCGQQPTINHSRHVSINEILYDRSLQ